MDKFLKIGAKMFAIIIVLALVFWGFIAWMIYTLVMWLVN